MNLEDMMKEIGEEMLSSESFDDSDDWFYSNSNSFNLTNLL